MANRRERILYREVLPALVSQLAEETDSKPVQCEFESHRGHRNSQFNTVLVGRQNPQRSNVPQACRSSFGGIVESVRDSAQIVGEQMPVAVERQFSDDEDFKRQFRREAHAAARWNTPHVVPIHHYGEIDGRLYVDIRLIEGRDLHAVLVDGPLEVRHSRLLQV